MPVESDVTRHPDLRPPKVLLVTAMYPDSGRPSFGIFVQRQRDALAAAGCRQELLVIDGWRSRVSYLRGIARVRAAVKSGEYDLVHAYHGLCGFVAACQGRVPLIITYCGSDLNPGFAGRDRATLRSALVNALGQIAALRAEACIVRTGAMLSRLRSRRAHQRARVIPSGIDLSLFRPGPRQEARRRLGWDPVDPTILFVCADAALPAVKQPELAQAVIKVVRKKLPRADFRVVAGKPQAELPDHYNAADVLLVTSASEGSPSVVKEALACNLPVVSTRVGDVPELLHGLPNCHACEPDPTMLAARVLEVLTSSQRTTGRERVSVFSIAHTTRAILETYRDARLRTRRGARMAHPLEGTIA